MTTTHRGEVRRLTHRQGPNFSLGFRFLPFDKRRAVYAAYAVCRIADDIVDEVPPTAPTEGARAELDAWQEEVARAYEGTPSHPATTALAEVLERFPIPMEAFLGLIEGCRWDLAKHRYATFTELERYCELVAVTISDISLAIFGAVHPDAPDRGRDLALALQLTNICRDVGEDVGRDRIYLPLDELARFGVEEAALLRLEPGPGFAPLMAYQAVRARDRYRRASLLPSMLAGNARLAVRMMGGVYVRILERIAAEPTAVLSRRVRPTRADRGRVVLAGFLGRPFE